MTQPREHCGELPPGLGLDGAIPPGECVLRPGHSGSHATDNGMRWTLAPRQQSAEEAAKEAGQPNPWDVAWREGARSRDREIAELRDELTKARQGVVASIAPAPSLTDQSDTQSGVAGCTCIPWTRQGGAPRYCQPGDTVDKISGWERGKDCPHHAPAATARRHLYAAAIASYDHAVGQATNPAPRGHHYGQADAALAVRDRELEQLRAEVAELEAKADGWRHQAFLNSQALARMQDAATLHRQGLIGSLELYAVIGAALDPQEQP